jgi:hypothetical protein
MHHSGLPRAVNKSDAVDTLSSQKVGTSSAPKQNSKSNEYDIKQLRVLRRALEYLDEHGMNMQALAFHLLVPALAC